MTETPKQLAERRLLAMANQACDVYQMFLNGQMGRNSQTRYAVAKHVIECAREIVSEDMPAAASGMSLEELALTRERLRMLRGGK